MRIAFLLHELGGAGGMGVVTGHARRLGAEIVLAGSGGGSVDGVTVRSLDDAREVEYDVAVATWWETAPALWELRTRSRAVFLQSLEERFYNEDELWERYGAASVLGLPVHFVTIGRWLRDVVTELRPDALCPIVPNGIDKDVFVPRAEPVAADGPLRVLVEGQPDLWFKAVPEAIDAARAVGDGVTVTLVAPEPESAADLGADRVTGRLGPNEMAALYAEHDVLLKLSRVEGVALGPIEAMHVGTPVVTTPVTGHDEYVKDGENALVVGFDEPGAATNAIARLRDDRELLARLSRGALKIAAAWPTPEQSSAAMQTALAEIFAALPLDPAPALALAASRRRLGIEQGRALLGRLRYNERGVAELTELADDLRAAVTASDEKNSELYRQIDAIRDERAYRAAARLRGVARKVTRKGDE